jgi:hypothetical protein
MAIDPYDNILNAEKVLLLVREFIEEHRITSSDAIEQSGRVVEHAPDFIEELCKAAGWAEPDDLDEEEDITGMDYDEDNPHGLD